MLLDAAQEVHAHAMWRKARAVHGHRRLSPPAARTATKPTHRFFQDLLDTAIGQPPQEAIHGGEVGHARQSQHGAQLLMFAQSYLGFAIW
jgi:hypothetical protein